VSVIQAGHVVFERPQKLRTERDAAWSGTSLVALPALSVASSERASAQRRRFLPRFLDLAGLVIGPRAKRASPGSACRSHARRCLGDRSEVPRLSASCGRPEQPNPGPEDADRLFNR
jgi:hypothetical protein